MYKRFLTCDERSIIKGALLNRSLATENMFHENAKKLLKVFDRVEQVVLYMEDDEDGGEQRAIDAMEAGIAISENSFGDD